MILLAYGEETYLVRQKVRQIIEKARAEGTDDSNIVTLDAEGTELPNLRESLQSSGMFGGRRLVVIRDWLGSRSADEGSDLAEALAEADESIVVVIAEHGVLDQRRAGVKQIRKLAAKEWSFPRLDEVKATTWVNARAKEISAAINPAAARRLVDLVSTDLWALSNELEKLALNVGSGQITADLVDQMVSEEVSGNIFTLVDALGRRDGRIAAGELRRLLDQGEAPLRIFAMIVRQFRMLLLTKTLAAQGAADGQLAKQLRVPPFAVKKIRRQADSFTDRELRQMYEKLADMDLDFKTGQVEPDVGLELFVTETCAEKTPAT